ncbi:histidine-rich glycoprotein-like [Galleria mellonella]|uniref:Histidine-rich glycoprotein-like n=1 Tax=Galleria mellonella TaxID=7137 RepID=A0ABM3MGV8_GALME|nr:histidine-rich glycoprotein-like [Galleria mellonella]
MLYFTTLVAAAAAQFEHHHGHGHAYSSQHISHHTGHHHDTEQHGHHEHEHHDYHAHPKYEFEYKVSDPHTGDHKSQHETRDGDHVTGSYSLKQPDGSEMTVHYHGDHHSGFHATIKHGTHHLVPHHKHHHHH